jgi:ABC-type uncharacterized transport system permease subunit
MGLTETTGCLVHESSAVFAGEERVFKQTGHELSSMIISIPLFSPLLLIAAALIALGLLVTPLSHRLGVIGIGLGSVIMGAVVLAEVPRGLGYQAIIPFGLAVIVGVWMVAVGIKEG